MEALYSTRGYFRLIFNSDDPGFASHDLFVGFHGKQLERQVHLMPDLLTQGVSRLSSRRAVQLSVVYITLKALHQVVITRHSSSPYHRCVSLHARNYVFHLGGGTSSWFPWQPHTLEYCYQGSVMDDQVYAVGEQRGGGGGTVAPKSEAP